LLANQIFPAGWIAVIYDRQGTIAGRKLNPETFIGKKVAPQVLQWLEGPAERLGEGRTLEGRMSVAAMARSAQTGYSVTASVPEAVLEGPLRQALVINAVAVLASLGLGVFMAWRFAQSMRRSIQELELATESVASGHTHEVLATGATAELGRLSQRFNSMVGALQEARAAQQRYQQELEHAASHDPLTGLANRMLVVDRIERAVTQARRNQRQVAVLLLDLDRFKVINDTLTHGSGDMVLIEVAQRLTRQVRDIDTVARLGGDEFLVVLGDIASESEAALLADKLLKALAEPLVAKGHELRISGSLGIAVAPRDGELAGDLIMHADIAMYRAKENGRDQFEFFSVDMNARLSQRIELEAGLRRALDNDQLVLYYQPRCDIATGRILGAEALIRWKHPVDGLVPPGKFIPVAEETGLIVPIGEWVLKTACADARRWQAQGLGALVVGVNVSARQFQFGKLSQLVAQQLQISGLPPELLELELTESAVMNDPQRTLQVLHEIKAIGARVALDDFGTGYSSLGYLKRFPVDCLKIDQSFVRDITVDPEDAAIARMVITLGHSLRQEVIAEGVETHAQLQYLREQGCDMVQGYLFSPPVPVDEFEDMVRRGRRLPT
jgi:diguanylate cyclase (GGDEF)-like protein